MKDLLNRLNAMIAGPKKSSKDDAKQRLKVLLIHDQVDLTPGQMEQMKQEILEVISRYAEVRPEGVDIRLSKREDGVAVESLIPVSRVTARA